MISTAQRKELIRTIFAAMFHKGLNVDALNEIAKQELRDGIDALLMLADNRIDTAGAIRALKDKP